MITKQRPPLIYTIERSGTNFICHGFNYIFLNPVSTHDKNKKFTFGEDIDYKKYRVFSTIREPKELLLSEIYALYEQLPEFSLEEVRNCALLDVMRELQGLPVRSSSEFHRRWCGT